MHSCDCYTLCGLDHCCAIEMRGGDRCPQRHPLPLVIKARRGNHEAAREVLKLLRDSTWRGITREEMVALANGDQETVTSIRRERARIRARYSRNRARYTRWKVDLSIMLGPGHLLSSHEAFRTREKALQWAEQFIDSRERLAGYLDELNAKRPWSGDPYKMGETTEVGTILLFRERQLYPWHWTNDYPVWTWEDVEWYWESEVVKARRESGKGSWSVTVGGKQVAPLPVAA